ncbi:Uncharacterised protein [Mycobacteroides abscessus subsp. abscessus]|nr:Uncharacterised protein [Mycobacteroides abscessus subsp. abscessus]
MISAIKAVMTARTTSRAGSRRRASRQKRGHGLTARRHDTFGGLVAMTCLSNDAMKK